MCVLCPEEERSPNGISIGELVPDTKKRSKYVDENTLKKNMHVKCFVFPTAVI